jgi:hypothetical protein
MRRLLTFVGVFSLLVVGASGQSPQPGENSPSRNSKKARKAHDAPSKPNDSFRVPTLEELHDQLRKYRNLHDTYFYVGRVGNEETVPLLLERFRLDYGTSEPPGGGVYGGFDCAQLHLVDALRSITNTDQGMYYPRWRAWWDTNRGLSQHQWIHNGFVAAGLHVVEPVDERFALELIDIIGRGQGHLVFNAWRQLFSSPPEHRAEWVALASASDQRFLRLGSLRLLGSVDAGHEDLLRTLAADSDLEIRRTALTILDDHLRVSPSVVSTRARNLRAANREDRIRALCFIGDTLVTVSNNGNVEAFDPREFRKLWTRRVFPGAADRLVVSGDHVILAGWGGGLAVLDRSGQILWHREPTDASDQTVRVSMRGDDIVVARLLSVEQVDGKTGARKSVVPAIDFVRDADSSETSAFFVDKRGLRPLKDGAEAEYKEFSGAIGVSVSQQSVCVTSTGGPIDRVTCMTPDTLSVQWTRPIGRNGTWGHGLAPIQAGSRVFVPTDQDLTAFAASDGSLLWTISGGQEAHGRIAPTDYGLLMQSMRYKPELRDPVTGEVRRAWPQIEGVSQLAVRQQFAAIAGLDGALWIVDLAD